MPDILIRNVSEAAVERIDHAAAELGLSRNEYLRRRFEVEQPLARGEMSAADLKRASYAARDLLDPEVMDAAWR